VTHSDSETKPKSKLLFPGLESFYAVAVPLAWPIVRIAVGWNLLVHGWGKVMRGSSAYVRGFVEQGFDPALPWIWAALTIEFVGGIALILGLFTRFFAAAAAVEMLIITVLYWKAGFSWLNRGYEYTLLWGRLLGHRAARRGTLLARSPHRRRALSDGG
jgi:putative oxidoreductase